MRRIALLAALATALAACTEPRSETAAPDDYMPDVCMDESARERIRAALLDGLDAALRSQMQTVFAVWMKDHHDQPARARHGMQNAIRAYIHARNGALKWNPAAC